MAASTSLTNQVLDNAIAAASLNATNADQATSSWFWRWYKQSAGYSAPQQQQQQQEKQPQILYQQLTKDNAENIELEKDKSDDKHQQKLQSTKARAVLDNLLLHNNNNNEQDELGGCAEEEDGVGAKEDGVGTQAEALEHGERFLRYLERCGDPSVTAMQIMQIRAILGNIRAGRRAGHCDKKVRRK